VIDLVPWSAVLPLRHRVLRPGLPLDAARFAEDRAPDTFHVARPMLQSRRATMSSPKLM